MTTQEKRRQVKEAIVRAVPRIQTWKLYGKNDIRKSVILPITLADVIYAIGKIQKRSSYYLEVGSGRFVKSENLGNDTSRDTDTGVYWNPLQDFDHQSEAFYLFAWELLVNNK